MQGCDNFKEITLNSCPDAFKLTAGLTANTNYGVEFTSKFNNKIYVTQSADNTGKLTIPVNIEFSLSKDLFHGFSGAWKLRLYALDESNNPTSMQLCGYDYLVLIFEDVTPLPDPNNANIDLC